MNDKELPKEVSDELERLRRRNEALERQARIREKAAKGFDLGEALKNAYECPQ